MKNDRFPRVPIAATTIPSSCTCAPSVIDEMLSRVIERAVDFVPVVFFFVDNFAFKVFVETEDFAATDVGDAVFTLVVANAIG